MTLLIALAIAATLLIGVAVLFQWLQLAESRRLKALLTSNLERLEGLPPGALERAADYTAPPTTPRRQKRDEEAERRARIQYALSRGLPVPMFDPSGKEIAAQSVEIR